MLYSSEIHYKCFTDYPETLYSDIEVKKPVLYDFNPENCLYTFYWETKYACSQCTRD